MNRSLTGAAAREISRAAVITPHSACRLRRGKVPRGVPLEGIFRYCRARRARTINWALEFGEIFSHLNSDFGLTRTPTARRWVDRAPDGYSPNRRRSGFRGVSSDRRPRPGQNRNTPVQLSAPAPPSS